MPVTESPDRLLSRVLSLMEDLSETAVSLAAEVHSPLAGADVIEDMRRVQSGLAADQAALDVTTDPARTGQVLVPREYLDGLLGVYHAASAVERLRCAADRAMLSHPRSQKERAAAEALAQGVADLGDQVCRFRTGPLGEDDE